MRVTHRQWGRVLHCFMKMHQIIDFYPVPKWLHLWECGANPLVIADTSQGSYCCCTVYSDLKSFMNLQAVCTCCAVLEVCQAADSIYSNSIIRRCALFCPGLAPCSSQTNSSPPAAVVQQFGPVRPVSTSATDSSMFLSQNRLQPLDQSSRHGWHVAVPLKLVTRDLLLLFLPAWWQPRDHAGSVALSLAALGSKVSRDWRSTERLSSVQPACNWWSWNCSSVVFYICIFYRAKSPECTIPKLAEILISQF